MRFCPLTLCLSLSAVNIPEPTVAIVDNRVPYVSNQLSISCTVFIVATGLINNVDVSFSWTRDGGPVPSSATVGPTTMPTTVSMEQRLTFSSLMESDGGDYLCAVTISPTMGTISPLTVSEDVTLTVHGEPTFPHLSLTTPSLSSPSHHSLSLSISHFSLFLSSPGDGSDPACLPASVGL